jgi:hypothetical protein
VNGGWRLVVVAVRWVIEVVDLGDDEVPLAVVALMTA